MDFLLFCLSLGWWRDRPARAGGGWTARGCCFQISKGTENKPQLRLSSFRLEITAVKRLVICVTARLNVCRHTGARFALTRLLCNPPSLRDTIMSEAANTTSDNNGDAGLNGTVNITQLNVIVLWVESCMMIGSFTFERFVMVVDSVRLSFF